MRRLASATRISFTGVRARSASANSSAANSRSSIGSNLLKIGSNTTGARNDRNTVSATAAGPTTHGHAPCVAAAISTNPNATTDVSTRPTTRPLIQSTNHAPRDCVENSQRCS